MSRLDHHILSVRNKLMVGTFLGAWAWAGLILGVAVWLAIIAEHLFDRTIAHAGVLFWSGVGAASLGAFIYSLIRRPSMQTAAVEIDRKLDLKEKFSTALFARLMKDPFAQATVRDAEVTAENVSLYKRFPLEFPRQALGTAAVFILALLTALFMPVIHLSAKPVTAGPKTPTTVPSLVHDRAITQAMPAIEKAAALLPDNDQIQKATKNLMALEQTKDGDDQLHQRSALAALENVKQAIKDELEKNKEYNVVMNDKQMLSTIAEAKDDSTPMGKAQNELKAGDLDKAMKDIGQAVNDFAKLNPDDQQKEAEQAQTLAKALEQAANDPKATDRMVSQMMQMGATQPQAQQMAQAMKQAAQGNKNAAQQLQQMAQQVQQQMNNGQGPTQQQQQQIQKLMNQAQGLANSQAQAQALSNSAQQMAQSMKAASNSPQQGQQNGQQAPQPGQGGQQAMQQAQQNMQQQLGQMQAMAKNAQAMQRAADAAAQAAADSAAGVNGDMGNGTDPQGQSLADRGGDAPDHADQDPNNNQRGQPGQGQAGAGMGGGGGKMGMTMAPGAFKKELDPSLDNDKGKLLASRFVKAGIDKGEAKAQLRDAAAKAEQETSDEVDQDHVPREAQQAEKDYFTALQKQGQ